MVDFRLLVVVDAAPVWPKRLRCGGIQVEAVWNAELMNACDKATLFDLVLIDTGDSLWDKALCCEVRAVYNGPIVLLTAHADARYQFEAYLAGTDECVVKSTGLNVLQSNVAAWIQRVRIARVLRQEYIARTLASSNVHNVLPTCSARARR
jgi:DNA-binding response OmpR family regulator